jgi:hypothetical protein
VGWAGGGRGGGSCVPNDLSFRCAAPARTPESGSRSWVCFTVTGTCVILKMCVCICMYHVVPFQSRQRMNSSTFTVNSRSAL